MGAIDFEGDPLDELHRYPTEVQIAVIITELRNQRRMMTSVKAALDRLMIGIVLCTVTFAVGVFALLARHP